MLFYTNNVRVEQKDTFPILNIWVTLLSVFQVRTIPIKVLINKLVYYITRNITIGHDRKR